MSRNGMINLLLLLASAGCAAGRQADVLESQLRQQENVISQLNSEVIKLRTDLTIAQQDAGALRNQLAGKGEPVIPVEQASLFYRMTAIQIDELQSAWLAGEPGQLGEMSLLISPLDEFQTAFRIPGEIEVFLKPAAKQGSPSENEISLKFPAEQVRAQWTSGWVSSGFVLQIPQEKLTAEQLQLLAKTESCRVKIIFRTADGREFKDELSLKKRTDHSAIPLAPVAETSPQVDTGIQPTRFEETDSPQPVVNPDPFPLKPAPVPPIPTPTENRIDTSDRRTIEEFPVYR